jgi:uncharacterized cupin superfamily protein
MPEAGEGWFVVDAREAQWRGGNGRSAICGFEPGRSFPELGINVNVIEPGALSTLYHAEGAQECFLVVAGECLLLIEGTERLLRAWDFVYCPAGTSHALVATDRRCVVFQVGARPSGWVVYPVSPSAQAHGVGVERETTSVGEAYGDRRRVPVAFEAGWLPDLAPADPG